MSDEWLRIIEEAHTLGIPASATMMYGHIESNYDIAEHFRKIVELQKRLVFLWHLFPGVLNRITHRCKKKEQLILVLVGSNF